MQTVCVSISGAGPLSRLLLWGRGPAPTSLPKASVLGSQAWGAMWRHPGPALSCVPAALEAQDRAAGRRGSFTAQCGRAWAQAGLGTHIGPSCLQRAAPDTHSGTQRMRSERHRSDLLLEVHVNLVSPAQRRPRAQLHPGGSWFLEEGEGGLSCPEGSSGADTTGSKAAEVSSLAPPAPSRGVDHLLLIISGEGLAGCPG